MFHLRDIEKRLQLNSYLRTQVVFVLDVLMGLVASMGVILIINLLLPWLGLTVRFVWTWLVASLIASTIAMRVGRAYRAIIRYSTLRELGRFALVTLGKEALLAAGMILVAHISAGSGLLWGMVLIDFLITLVGLLLMRVAMVVAYDVVRGTTRHDGELKPVLVYGVSDKAVAAVSRLRNSSHYRVAGFISPGRELADHVLAGMPVHYFQGADDVKEIAEETGAAGVLFPYVADARSEQDRLVRHCHDFNLRTYIIPGIDEVAAGGSLGRYIRKIKIEDLLCRNEIKISMGEIMADFAGKTVLVTGAAGSIGSELCRQIATFGVKRLILFDNAETPLHNIRLELEDTYPSLDFVPVIGDVRDRDSLDFTFRRYMPQVVFHAAAYKHVPLMEENPCQAVCVNVVGSRQVADKCVEYGVDKMVMVSTDKAVNPTSVMGCTKRLAEIYVQSLGLAIERGEIPGHTRFVTTRFGNVLGSSGSVIPRFREQIERGGPITVTHPEINRFFMTIPEACRLVMEAATFATGTQIFVFDMGESVRIVDLADRMIRLAGLVPGRDIHIAFTGLRPGEKLYEEVLATKENTLPTNHERIFVAKAREYPHAHATIAADRLARMASGADAPARIADLIRLMQSIVPEYHPARQNLSASLSEETAETASSGKGSSRIYAAVDE